MDEGSVHTLRQCIWIGLCTHLDISHTSTSEVLAFKNLSLQVWTSVFARNVT